LARLQKAPIAIEAVERIDALFAIEHEINGLAPEQRLAVRSERSRPLVVELETWLRQQHAKLSRRSETAKAIDYSLKRWTALTRFLDDGRLCMSNNAAERAVRVAMTDFILHLLFKCLETLRSVFRNRADPGLLRRVLAEALACVASCSATLPMYKHTQHCPHRATNKHQQRQSHPRRHEC
jgi:Transposase IS66 family